jgi:hypothetical protein
MNSTDIVMHSPECTSEEAGQPGKYFAVKGHFDYVKHFTK